MKPNNPVLRVALTGGIACGKSEVGRELAGLGVRVVEADELAHGEMRRGSPVHEAVLRHFGASMAGPDGEIDRRKLGRHVFADAAEREALNALVHPAVLRKMDQELERARREGCHAVAIIPLLFEIGAERGWDAVICVAADPRVALKRLCERGLSEEEALSRMAAQWPLKEKIKRSDWLIENNGSRRELADITRRIWNEILMQKEKEHHG